MRKAHYRFALDGVLDYVGRSGRTAVSDPEQMVRRQRILGDFGEFALGCEDLDAVLTEACRLVGEALGTNLAKVMEIEEEGNCLLVRAGVGWGAGIVGEVRLPLGERSSETYSIHEGEPIITPDIGNEDRFEFPTFMKKAGVVNMPIFLPGRKPYGLLQIDSREAWAVSPRWSGLSPPLLCRCG